MVELVKRVHSAKTENGLKKNPTCTRQERENNGALALVRTMILTVKKS